MRKIFLLLMIILTVSGCGSEENDSPRIGMLTQLNSAPEDGTTFFDNFNSMVMALNSKTIDTIKTFGGVAKYMIAKNPDLVIKDSQTVPLVDNFCCAVREEDVDLKTSFDAAIASMKDDGTLDAFVKDYIDNPLEVPPAVDIPKIDGADTIKVGVTGDLPLLDFVLADGTPAGFNTAVLAEISKRIGKNIELVQIDSGARSAALMSKQVDVVFLVVVPADDSNRPKDIDTPAGILVTTPYYRDVVVDVNISSLAAGF